MPNTQNLTSSPSWKKLQSLLTTHWRELTSLDFAERREASPNYQIDAACICLDYKRNLINSSVFEVLCQLAREANLGQKIDDLFSGKNVNITEQRPALHTALRSQDKTKVSDDIEAVHHKMERLVNQAHQSDITDVINIGVGGSDLGPKLVYEALKHNVNHKLNCHFISGFDKTYIHALLKRLNPATTLVIIASKSFKTAETMTNAEIVLAWLKQYYKNVIAVTANKKLALEKNINEENIYPIWDWVGGRYSVWSAVGLPIALAFGMDVFRDFLNGAHQMDAHFKTSDFETNMPVVMALLEIWYRNFYHTQARAIIAYSQSLRFLPEYMQQLHMESLGKTVQVNGDPTSYTTGGIIWGGVGSDTQHSIQQFLMQGSFFTPVDFILPIHDACDGEKREQAISNCEAQAKVLWRGYPLHEVSINEGAYLAYLKTIDGNKPSNMITFEKINATSLGALLALYEHKVYVQSVIWNINAFDQFGVERAKELAMNEYVAASER